MPCLCFYGKEDFADDMLFLCLLIAAWELSLVLDSKSAGKSDEAWCQKTAKSEVFTVDLLPLPSESTGQCSHIVGRHFLVPTSSVQS